jgi:hypothetical protein
MTNGKEFPLKFGMATHVTYEARPKPIVSYRIDPARRYEVRLMLPTGSELAGTAHVEQRGPEDIVVRPDFIINFPPDDCKFYGGFSVNETGMATLETVYLVVK